MWFIFQWVPMYFFKGTFLWFSKVFQVFQFFRAHLVIIWIIWVSLSFKTKALERLLGRIYIMAYLDPASNPGSKPQRLGATNCKSSTSGLSCKFLNKDYLHEIILLGFFWREMLNAQSSSFQFPNDLFLRFNILIYISTWHTD